jgi:hypothetical protein
MKSYIRVVHHSALASLYLLAIVTDNRYEDEMKKKQKSKVKKSAKKTVSAKRMKEIEKTFQTLGIPASQPYQNANEYGNRFERVSIYTEGNYFYSTSNSSNG